MSVLPVFRYYCKIIMFAIFKEFSGTQCQWISTKHLRLTEISEEGTKGLEQAEGREFAMRLCLQ